MYGRKSIESEVAAILRERGYEGAIERDLALGAGGAALDSIALVELLLNCDERFGISIAAEMLEGEPLTFGRLADRIERALAR